MSVQASSFRAVPAILIGFVLLGALLACAPAQQGDDTPVIKIEARRFSYEPSRIELRKDRTIILELHSLDRIHGFNVPQLGLRTDVAPGHSTRVRVTPRESGTFVFMCDIFCGEGHDEMAGVIVVRD